MSLTTHRKCFLYYRCETDNRKDAQIENIRFDDLVNGLFCSEVQDMGKTRIIFVIRHL